MKPTVVVPEHFILVHVAVPDLYQSEEWVSRLAVLSDGSGPMDPTAQLFSTPLEITMWVDTVVEGIAVKRYRQMLYFIVYMCSPAGFLLIQCQSRQC